MGILDQKQKIFGNIAASRSLTEGLPQFNLNSSFPSINNGGDTITFLTDLIKSLVGYQQLQSIVETIVSSNLAEIERDIKNALKSELKSIVSCGVNPTLPPWIKSSGSGIQFTVSKIDFANLMRTNPNSDVGKTLYNDVISDLINSTDFNSFLYQTIQNNGTTESWGHQTTGSDILTWNFKTQDVTGAQANNTLTVKAHPSYDNKTLTNLNNDYIDSVKLFNTQNILTNLVDTIFGSVSTVGNKTLSQLQSDAKVQAIVTRISNANSNDVINDKYFSFTNAETNQQQIQAAQRKSGVNLFNTSTSLPVSVPFSSVQEMTSIVSAATNTLETKNAVSTSLNNIGNQLGAQAPNPVDANTVKMNFIQQLIQNLTNCIVDTILSPKVIAIFLINFKIVYGQNADFTDATDFLKKNKNLIHGMIKTIGAAIIKTLMVFALKEIAKLVGESIAKKQLDKNKLYVAQLLTMIGIPTSVLNMITELL